MIVDDKKRVIGKIVSINSDRFSVELLSGLKNFNVNGYDDIHYFAQINSYVIVPYQNYYIVSEVVSVREKDTTFNSSNIEQELNKVYSTKYLEVLPIGTITKDKFIFGASVYPTLYSDVLYIKDDELDLIFNVNNIVSKVCGENRNTDDDHSECPTRLNALTIGKSAIFQDYDIKIKIDNFFGGHSAVLGNTGSGKSCTISSMIQTLFQKEHFSAIGASFIFFDVNGEYKQAFEKIHEINDDIDICYTSLEDTNNPFTLPQHLMNVEEWELLLNASEKAQLPILRNALNIASLLSKSSADGNSKKILNHIKAICIEMVLNGEGNDTNKHNTIKSIFRSFPTDDFNPETKHSTHSTFSFKDSYKKTHTENFNIENCIALFFASMQNSNGVKEIINDKGFIQQDGIKLFESSEIEPFEFKLLGQALELAILYEEAHGNNQIRNYCASLITRFKSLENREDFDFIKKEISISADEYINKFFGLNESKKKTQITIIDLNSAEDEIIEIVSSVLTRLFFDTLRKAVPRNQFPVNLVLEEAHRYIAYDSKRTFLRANQIFDRVAKEGRKYGLFFTISSQRPSELSKTVLSQCNNFIVHRIQNPDDLLHIRQITPHISETTLKKLPSIPTQHALIFGNAVNIPALFKVNDANPLPNSDNNEISTNWFIHKDKIIQIQNTKNIEVIEEDL